MLDSLKYLDVSVPDIIYKPNKMMSVTDMNYNLADSKTDIVFLFVLFSTTKGSSRIIV